MSSTDSVSNNQAANLALNSGKGVNKASHKIDASKEDSVITTPASSKDTVVISQEAIDKSKSENSARILTGGNGVEPPKTKTE